MITFLQKGFMWAVSAIWFNSKWFKSPVVHPSENVSQTPCTHKTYAIFIMFKWKITMIIEKKSGGVNDTMIQKGTSTTKKELYWDAA